MVRKKAVIEDVARLSGVSKSTVDRVLNGRPGVREATVARVRAVLKQLDYAPSALAARAPSRRVELFVTAGSNAFFAELARGVGDAIESVQSLGSRFLTHEVDPYDERAIVAALSRVGADTESVVTVAMDTPAVSDAIDRLEDRGVRVVTLVSDAPRSRRTAYVGQDNFAVGRTAGSLMGLLVPRGKARVAVLIGHLQFRHHLDRRSGFQQALGLARPEIDILQPRAYGPDAASAERLVRRVLADAPDLEGVYLAGGGQEAVSEMLIAEAAGQFPVLAHEVTEQSRRGLTSGAYTMILAHDVEEIGRKAVEAALAETVEAQPQCAIGIFVRDNLPYR